jgi:hypothetical protein
MLADPVPAPPLEFLQIPSRCVNSLPARRIGVLVPAGAWDWFCLDRIPYRGRTLTIAWGKGGGKFGKGKGLAALCRRSRNRPRAGTGAHR